MIVRTQHPDRPEHYVFVPVHFDRQRGTWHGIVSKGRIQAFDNECDALTFALTHTVERWESIHRLSRLIRVLCEHESFRLIGDGIDDDLFRHQARDLAMRAYEFDNTLRHLLSQPGPDAKVELDLDGLAFAALPTAE